jgi:hypothetical protein
MWVSHDASRQTTENLTQKILGKATNSLADPKRHNINVVPTILKAARIPQVFTGSGTIPACLTMLLDDSQKIQPGKSLGTRRTGLADPKW